MRPEFSVVICNYNCGRYLAQSVESVLEQDFRPLEIIVVDDGSTDDSPERIQPYLGNVQWIAVAHGGQAAALNEALKFCRGSWIAFLESDDIWLPGKLKTVGECLESNPDVVAVQHSMNQVDEHLQPLPTRLPPESSRFVLNDFLRGHALLTGMSALIVRREVIEELLPLPADLTTCVDEYLQPRVLFQGFVFHMAQALGLRRIHGRNFFGGIQADPARLERYLNLRTVLDGHLRDFLSSHQLRMSMEVEARRRAERLQLDFFLYRWKHRWGRALRAFYGIIRLQGLRPYALFKVASLILALVSPRLYSGLHGVYEESDRLPKIREKIFP